MQLIGVPGMPEVTRVVLFMRYKGLEVPVLDPRVHLSLGKGFVGDGAQTTQTDSELTSELTMCVPQRTTALFEEVYAGQPMLELDDGLSLIGASAICLYVEETYPDPCLLGLTALERANTEMWQRQIETHVMSPLATYCFHSAIDDSESDVAHVQNDEWGQRNLKLAYAGIEELNARLSGSDYLAGGRFSGADLTLWSTLEFARVFGIEIPADCKSILAWREQVSENIKSETSVSARVVPTVSVASGPSIHLGQQTRSSVSLSQEAPRVIVVDREGRLTYANSHALNFYNFDVSVDIKTKSLPDFVGAQYSERVVKPIVARVLDTGEAKTGRGWVHYQQGSRKFVSASFSKFDDDSVLMVIRDLHHLESVDPDTSKNQLAGKLEIEAERTHLIDAVLGSTTDRVSVLSKTGHFVYVNNAQLTYYGIDDTQDVIGQHISTWIGAGHFHTVSSGIIEKCFQGETGVVETTYTRPDGRLASVEIDFFPYHERTGVVTGAILQTRDIEDAKTESLPQTVEPAAMPVAPDLARIRFTASILGATEGDRISAVDREMRYVYVNDEVLKAWHCESDSFTGRAVSECIGPEQTELIAPCVKKALEGEYIYRRIRYSDPTVGSRIIALEFYPYTELNSESPCAVIIKVHPLPQDLMRDAPEDVTNSFRGTVNTMASH